VFKKRWSDGLQDDFDHLNEFEFKLGCFGGDGGGSSGGGMNEGQNNTGIADAAGYGAPSGPSGGGSSNDAVSDALADALSNNIGDYSADDTNVDMGDTGQYGAGPSISSFSDLQNQVSDLANQSLASKNSTAVSDFQNQLASGMFAAPPSAPPSYGTPASYGPNAGVPTGYSVGVPAMDLDIGINAPVSDNLSGYTSTGTPTSTADVMAAALGLDNNIAGFNVAPGMVGNAPGLIGTTKFREGGAVGYPGYGQGMSGGGGIMSVLEPFGNYLTEQIDTQRVDPFLETVSNAAYQEFGIKPSQGGGGGGFFSGDFYKDNLGGDFSGMPPPLPAFTPDAAQQPVMNMDTELQGPVASLSNFGPDVGNGGLFGGGPPSPNVSDGRYITDAAGSGLMSQAPMDFVARPAQLPGPRIPEFSQGFTDLPQISQPGYGGQPMQLPYDPTPMNPLIMDSFVAAGGTLPDFSGSAQNYFGNNIDPRGPVTPMTPEDIFRQAQMRNMQQDVKSPEVQAYLDNIIQTGGRPTMMAPKIDYSNLAGNLLSAGPMNMADAGNLAAFNLGTNPPPQPLTPASVVGGLVDEYGNPASFSPAQLEAMLAATPTSSFQQGPNLSRPAPVPISPLESGTTVSPTGQLLHYGPLRGGLQLARRQFG
jgi:hypothetical protein